MSQVEAHNDDRDYTTLGDEAEPRFAYLATDAALARMVEQTKAEVLLSVMEDYGYVGTLEEGEWVDGPEADFAQLELKWLERTDRLGNPLSILTDAADNDYGLITAVNVELHD